ncbi:MAG: DUF2802 domain-containing protein [Pseudobdellovibrio sp.]
MNIILTLLTIFNIILLAGLSFSLYLKVKEKKEDLRLTKGLQLLQSKISILEDLSDKTDVQVRKLIQTLDQKAIEVRQTLMNTEEQVQRIDDMIQKGLQYSQELKENHSSEEMQSRQKTTLYVRAAKLAHQGLTLEEILNQVDLTPAEIQMIIKVNKENLQFSENHLPNWINQQQSQKTNELQQKNDLKNFADALSAQNLQFSNMPQTFEMQQSTPVTHNSQTYSAAPNSEDKNIRPFEFRRITKP